jgi:integrase/recombinase XerD
VRRHSYVILGHFFAWWERQGGPVNPLADMEPPTRPNVRRRGLTQGEQDSLAQRLEAAPPKDRAIVLLMLNEGFRISDVAGLAFEDVDFAGGRIRCRDGKGGSDTWLPLNRTVAAALQDWGDVMGVTTGPVFTGPNGNMTTRGISKAWHRVCGPELDHLTSHQARHTYATRLIRGKTDANTVRRLMRHSSLAVTQQYIDEDPEAQRAAIDSLDAPTAWPQPPESPVVSVPTPPTAIDEDWLETAKAQVRARGAARDDVVADLVAFLLRRDRRQGFAHSAYDLWLWQGLGAFLQWRLETDPEIDGDSVVTKEVCYYTGDLAAEHQIYIVSLTWRQWVEVTRLLPIPPSEEPVEEFIGDLGSLISQDWLDRWGQTPEGIAHTLMCPLE